MKQEQQYEASMTSMDRSAMSSTPMAVTPPPTEKETRKAISTRAGLMTIVKSSWLNVMLVFVPLGIASHFVWPPTVTFVLNFLAIVPLAKLLGFATEDIALRTGEVK